MRMIFIESISFAALTNGFYIHFPHPGLHLGTPFMFAGNRRRCTWKATHVRARFRDIQTGIKHPNMNISSFGHFLLVAISAADFVVLSYHLQ